MHETIISLMEQYGYPGILFLIALENIFPPIPSEVILTFGGFLTTYTSLGVPGVVLAATLGSLAGAAVLYGAGALLNKERLKKLAAGRAGKLLGLKPEDVEKADGKRRKPAQPEARRRGGNQFRNFEERKTDYDAMILEQWQ